MGVVNANALALGYGGKAIVENLNFSLPQGASLAIVGANGSGKTTLIKAMLGLLKPLHGEIKVPIQGHVGYLPQHDNIMRDFPASVLEVVRTGALARCLCRKQGRAKIYAEAVAHLKELGMADYVHAPFACLSGGQRQRVLLARAFMAGDLLLILDEPSSAIDHESASLLYQVLQERQAKVATSLVLITHHPHEVHAIADYWLYLEGGRQAFFGDRLAFDQAIEKGEISLW